MNCLHIVSKLQIDDEEMLLCVQNENEKLIRKI